MKTVDLTETEKRWIAEKAGYEYISGHGFQTKESIWLYDNITLEILMKAVFAINRETPIFQISASSVYAHKNDDDFDSFYFPPLGEQDDEHYYANETEAIKAALKYICKEQGNDQTH
jgi:hypothetical protein